MKKWVKRLICCVMVTAAAAAWNGIDSAHAQTSSGWINDNFSYEDLALKRGFVYSTRPAGRFHSCVFSGKIINTSGLLRQNINITFYAVNVFDEQMWSSSVHIQSLPPYESHEFSNKISCKDEEPYKWRFEVVESPATANP